MKGKLLLIGGNVDKGSVFELGVPTAIDYLNFFEEGILERMLAEVRHKSMPIEIVTSASLIPAEIGSQYLKAFRRLGKEIVGLLNPKSKEEADNPEVLARLKRCSAVMFAGGDQSRLEKIFSGTVFLKTLKERLLSEEDFLASGTSAGAMAFGKEMINGGDRTERIVKGGLIWGKGFGLIESLIIDSHFINKRRFNRLIEAVATFPDLLGIGLGEDTAVLIKNGVEMETIGTGLVVIMDARETKENSFRDIKPGENICLENVLLHILAKDRKFNINERQLERG